MQRITITLDDDLMDELDQMIVEQGYQDRSEAIRDFTRAGMQQAAQKMGNPAAASPRWSMSTTMPHAIYRDAWWRTITAIMISRWRRFTFTSTMTIAWR